MISDTLCETWEVWRRSARTKIMNVVLPLGISSLASSPLPQTSSHLFFLIRISLPSLRAVGLILCMLCFLSPPFVRILFQSFDVWMTTAKYFFSESKHVWVFLFYFSIDSWNVYLSVCIYWHTLSCFVVPLCLSSPGDHRSPSIPLVSLFRQLTVG